MPRKAKARLLYETISTSERVSGLGAKGALLFTWLLAHCDDQGRYAGSANRMKAQVVPLIDDITVEDVEGCLNKMEEARLITRYQDGTYGQLLQVANWWEWQGGLRFKNPSRYPAPEGWQDYVTEEPRDDRGRFGLKPPMP